MPEEIKNEVVLTQEEVSAFKEMLSKSAEKDAQIAALSEKISQMEQAGGDLPEVDARVVVGSEGHLKKTPDGDWIIGWSKKPNGRYVYREVNPANQNETIEFIDLIVLGKEAPVKTRFKDFSEDYAPEKITFVRKDPKPASITPDGVRDEMVYNEKTGEMEPTGRKVKASVVNDKMVKVAVVLDGKEVLIDESFINA